jgi:hypothetical protein
MNLLGRIDAVFAIAEIAKFAPVGDVSKDSYVNPKASVPGFRHPLPLAARQARTFPQGH